MRYLSLCLFLLSIQAFAQSGQAFRIDSLPQSGILLDKGWKWHGGDDPDFARVDFDDSSWESIDPTQDIVDLLQIQDGKIGWIRLKIRLSPALTTQHLILNIQQATATEIFVDGKKIARYGTIDSSLVTAVYTVLKLLNLPVTHDSLVIAVKVACQQGLPQSRFAGQGNYCFNAKLTAYRYLDALFFKAKELSGYAIAKTVSFMVLFILHFMFFLFYPSKKTHLYFSGMALFFAIHHFMWLIVILSMPVLNFAWLLYLGLIRVPTLGMGYSLLLAAIYAILGYKKDLIFWIVLFLTLVLILNGYLNYKTGNPILESFTILINSIAAIYITIKGLLDKKRFANLLLVGIFISLVGSMACWLSYFGFFPEFISSTLSTFFEFIGILSIPMSVSILLGQDFARTSKNLQQKLDEVQKLSEEKQQILSSQNETLEHLVIERTTELEQKNRELAIESSLERVRSSSLAMHQSDDLKYVVKVVFQSLQELDFAIDGAAFISTFIEESDQINCWIGDNHDYPTSFIMPYYDAPHIIDQWNIKKNGKDFFSRIYSKEEKNQGFDFLFEHTDMKTFLPEELKDRIMNQEYLTQSLGIAQNSFIGIHFHHQRVLTEQEIDILKRFAIVFDQAYIRFIDLQKAENQALETIKRASIDRVRAQIASMRTTADLQRITPLIWKELTILQVPFIRCGVFIMDETREKVLTY